MFHIRKILNKQNSFDLLQEKNTYLPNGSIDPWHNLAIYQVSPGPTDTLGFINGIILTCFMCNVLLTSEQSEMIFVIVSGTSHCYDMGDDLPTDPPQLTAVRNQITQQIAQWLS